MISHNALEQLVDAARSVLAGEPDAMDELREAMSELDETESEAEDQADAVEAARDRYVGDAEEGIEIDDLPLVEIEDEGVWVNAWLWVPEGGFED
jgi:hypothetical protein